MFEIGENVYHYTKAKTANENILESLSIKMGQFHLLNDPKEAKIWPFKFYARDSANNSSFDKTLFEKVSQCITRRTVVLCCSADDPSANKDNLDFDMRMGYGHSRMWSQYADEHKGVCLVLDKKKLHDSIVSALGARSLYFGNVKYGYPTSRIIDPYGIVYWEDMVESGIDKFIDAHIGPHMAELFFTKHLDWQDEWEYRWIFRSHDDTPIYIPIAAALKAIILGTDCPVDISNSIITKSKQNNISVFRAYWHGWSLSLFGDMCATDYDKQLQISFNGVSYNITIPCGGVFVQAINNKGNVQPIVIENNGDVKVIS